MARALDTTYHDRRLARRLEIDPEFRAEFEWQRREIAQIDARAAVAPVAGAISRSER